MLPIKMHTGFLFSVFVHRLPQGSAVPLGCPKIRPENAGSFSCHPPGKPAGSGARPSRAVGNGRVLGNGSAVQGKR